MSKTSLSIFLIKKEYTIFDQIKENCEVLKKYNENKILYYSPSQINTPSWLNSFFHDEFQGISISNARCLLLLKLEVGSENRIFALTFGYGKNFLKENVIEEDFGLKVILNSIEKNRIRKISKTDIGKNYKSSQEQLPKEGELSEFGFDINRDIIKFVTGKYEEEDFGKCILTGGDIFNIHSDKDINNIEELLVLAYNKYGTDSYKEKFPWLDNIRLMKNKKILEKLNEKCVKVLNEKNFDSLWIAIPEIINWDKVQNIKITGQKDKELKTDIDMSKFLSCFNNNKIENFEQLRNKELKIFDFENDIMSKWPLYKCIVGNIDVDGKTYAINNGNWYLINEDYQNDILQKYENINLSDIDFIEFKHNDEDEYNEKMVEHLKNSELMHKVFVPIGGGSGNKIEPCDIVYENNFIHIKISEGSQYLSHLFNQATVSSTMLLDSNFRTLLNQKASEKNLNYRVSNVFTPSQYNVILGIITKKQDEHPHIPFFSKVSIVYCKQQIENLGYNFYIKNIYKNKVDS